MSEAVCVASVLSALAVCMAGTCLAAESPSDPSYIPRLRQRVEAWRAELPAVKAAATAAAQRVIGGAQLYAAGTQRSFIQEANGRSGGLMLLREYTPSTELRTNDTILAATTGAPDDPGLSDLLAKAQLAGATVILFSSAGGERPASVAGARVTVLPREPFRADEGDRRISTASVANIVGLWTWVAEFVSASVEQGKMPCMYQSYGRPGGREWADKYRNLRFHERTEVTPSDAAGLGARYLDGLAAALDNVWTHDRAGLARGADLIRQCHAAGGAVRVSYIAHMFPPEMQVPQNPVWFADIPPTDRPATNDLTIVLGYQTVAQSMPEASGLDRGACILTTSEKASASFTADPRHIYLDPYWEVDDALVTLKGYAIKILPISGIMQAAIYWQLAEASTAPAAPRAGR